MKFSVTTLGCKVNQYESDAMRRLLEDKGLEYTQSADHADWHIINTCTVTQKASMQSRQAVRRAMRASLKAEIIITGCYAQTDPKALEKISPSVIITANADKNRITEIICKNQQPSRKKEREQLFKEFPCLVYSSRSRPFLKIQDGCNSFCSYCIVPYARGKSRSMNPQNVIENLHKLHEAGFNEAVLTGIHLGAYGADLSPQSNLYELLLSIEKAVPIRRIRISSVEPHELDENIIQLAAQSSIFCRHFHIPLQSGDDLILKKMKRPHSSGLFKKLVKKIAGFKQDFAIGADIIAGFPGETDKAFQNTYNLIKELPLTYLHVFPFSSRKGTPAAKFQGKVDISVIKERCSILRTLGKEKKELFYKNNIGKKLQIIVEGEKKGISSNYIPVRFIGQAVKNKIVNIKITGVKQAQYAFGEIC